MDGTIPLGHLPYVLEEITKICNRYDLKVANIFHAGDGNLHPLIMYDANTPGETKRPRRPGAEILSLCVSVGGCLTGEHGVGIEKRDLMKVQFTTDDLSVQLRIKNVFDPDWLLNSRQGIPARRNGPSDDAAPRSQHRSNTCPSQDMPHCIMLTEKA